jgi:N-acetylglucosaminyldiphosphoundecaprenol N-acetyl-beta-D-mannosaminyltransferase
VFTPNSEMLLRAWRDPEFAAVLNKADLTAPDGIGVVYAAKILKQPLPERVAGFDLISRVLETASDGRASFYFFGSKPGVAERAKEKLLETYPSLKIAGAADGYFDAEKEAVVRADIREKAPDFLLVCLGMEKQEKWICGHVEGLNVSAAFGLGGVLDVFAGEVKRAPDFFAKNGLEWFYRLVKQPARLWRMTALPRFMLIVLFKGRRKK